MKKTALLTITGLFPFVVFSQPLDLLNNYRKERSRFLGPENLFGLIPARILRRWFATAAESIFGMRI